MRTEMVESDVLKFKTHWISRKRNRRLKAMSLSTNNHAPFAVTETLTGVNESKATVIQELNYKTPDTTVVFSSVDASPPNDSGTNLNSEGEISEYSFINECLNEVCNLSLEKPTGNISEHKLVSIEVISGSDIQMKIIEIHAVQGVSVNALIELKVDNFVEGTRKSFVELVIEKEHQLVYDMCEKVNPVIVHRKQGKHELYFRLLVHYEFPCDVELTSLSPLFIVSSVMLSITETLWKTLGQVVSAASLFHEVMCVRSSLPTSSIENQSISSNINRIVLTTSWMTHIEKLTDVLNLILTSHSICENDRNIILKGATTEILMFLMASTFDKSRKRVILYAVFNQVRLLINASVFESGNRASEMKEIFRVLHHDKYDFLRENEIVIAILCLRSLFSDRPGVSCDNHLQEQSSLLLALLDKYVQAKVSSCEWIMDSNAIWQLLDQYFNLVVTRKSVFESLLVLPIPEQSSRSLSKDH